jgi:hypothetical protein
MVKKKNNGSTVGGCLILVVLGLIVAGCNTLFGIGDNAVPAVPVVPAVVVTTPVATLSASPIADLDEDGIADRRDNDADGDGVRRSVDLDDRDPDKGKPKPQPTREREPAPDPEPEPAPVPNVHPGGFCGSPGAVGIADNGRTYICRDGHWRR